MARVKTAGGLLLASWILALGAGCGTSQEWAGEGVCVRDAELVEQLASLLETQHDRVTAYSELCATDDTCPCGMHCDLGACAAACSVNVDCDAGEVCDAFGRCIAPALANLPVTVSGETRGSLFVQRTQLDLEHRDMVAPLSILARVQEVEDVRVLAEPGLEVSCDAGASFSRSCRTGALAVDAAAVPLWIRAVGEWPSEDLRSAVYVNAPGQSFTVGVLKRGAPAPQAPVRHGVYVGVARLVGAGLSARTPLDEPLPDELARLELPITAEIFPETGGVYAARFSDVRQTVFPAGAAGSLTYNPVSGNWELHMASRQYLGEDVDAPADTQLDVHVSARMTDARFSDGLLKGELVSVFEGLAPQGLAPFARWAVSLTRVRDLPTGAVRPDQEPRPVSPVSARANTPLADELLAQGQVPDAPLPASGRAAAYLCTPSGTPSRGLGTGTDGSGDLRCTGGSTQLAFGVESGRLSQRGTFLDGCVAGLELTAAGGWGAANVQGACMDRSRGIAAAVTALSIDRERALGSGIPSDRLASTLGQRVLTQWMGAQSLVALEPRRLFRVGTLLPAGPALDRLRHYAQPGQVLASVQRSISAWDLMLHPRVGSALTNLSQEALVHPDYRPLAVAGTYPAGEQNVGLPVTMLTTLTRQLEGLRGVIEDLTYYRVLGSERTRVAGELSRFLPRNVVLFALSTGLHDAARAQSAVPWRPQWENAKRLYGSAMAKLVDQIELLESGVNPLGIEESDLPLYRLGDQEGTVRRFSAVSDSLLGREDLLDPAIAPTLIDRARDSEQLARGSVSALLERELISNLQESETDRRLEDVRRHYGDQITSYCATYDALTVLDVADEVDVETCFIAPHCSFTQEVYEARLSLADLGYQVCLSAKLRQQFGDAVTTGNAELDRQLTAIGGDFAAETGFFDIQMPEAMVRGFKKGYDGVKPPSIKLPDGVDAEAVRKVEALCASAREVTAQARPRINPASCAHVDECALGSVCQLNSGRCEPERIGVQPDCFVGSLGEAALAVHAASTDVDVARSELEEHSERYDNAMRGCVILEQGHAAIEGAMIAHNRTMAELAQAKFAADTAAQVAEKMANAFSLDKLWKLPGYLAVSAVQQALESTSGTLQLRMDNVERQHELTLARLEGVTEERLCYNQAEAELVGARSAALRVQRQSEELSLRLLEFNNLKIYAAAAIHDGLVSLDTERARAVSPPNVDHWLDANVDLHELRMRRARRALYLATQAVEYEFQFTSSERASVLAAQTPAELEGSLNRLRDFARRGAPPGGGNPAQLLAVLSLRKNLMQVSDRSGHVDGAHTLDDVERFRRTLLSPRYAVYDAVGRYTGQEIPFTIQPLGRLGLADTGAVPLFSGLSCAERLWSVNASIIGRGLMKGSDTSLATLQLRKRNTFSSHHCGPLGTHVEQVSSTRPSQNLFVDPMSASTWGDDDLVSNLTEADSGQETAFSLATVQARLNVDRRTLESVAFRDGQSTALAGRGVYGDYTLFIPASTQSISGSVGLLIEQIDDVLIRLDYVAAERR